MSSPAFRPVRAASPLLRDLVDGAFDENGQLVFRSAVLAHLAVQSGAWRVRQGENTWEQAGSDGVWSEIPKVVVDGVSWYSLDPRWQWRSVMPLPTPRTEAAGPITATPGAKRAKSATAKPATAKTGPVAVTAADEAGTAEPIAVAAAPEDNSARARAARVHDRPLLRAVTDRTA